MVGIYIHGASICRQILAGEKTVETRNRDTLGRFLGQRVAIIETGTRHGARVVAYADVAARFWWSDETFHRPDVQRLHRVPAGSKYDSGPRGKYGYLLQNVRPVDPFPAPRVHPSRVWQPVPGEGG